MTRSCCFSTSSTTLNTSTAVKSSELKYTQGTVCSAKCEKEAQDRTSVFLEMDTTSHRVMRTEGKTMNEDLLKIILRKRLEDSTPLNVSIYFLWMRAYATSG